MDRGRHVIGIDCRGPAGECPEGPEIGVNRVGRDLPVDHGPESAQAAGVQIGQPFRIDGSLVAVTGFEPTSQRRRTPLDEVLPGAVTAYVPGCPPKPEAIILGVVKALGTLGG